MATIFLGSKVILFVDYKTKEETIAGAHYTNISARFKETIKEERRGKLARERMPKQAGTTWRANETVALSFCINGRC